AQVRGLDGRLLLRAARARAYPARRAARLPRPRAEADRGRRNGARLAQHRLLARHRAHRGLRAGPGGLRDAPRAPAARRVVTALTGRDIVCVGFNDWDNDLWTNQHHLMARLAAVNRVLFVESLGLRRPQLTAGRDVRRIARRVRRGLAGARRVSTPFGGEGVLVLSPLVVPLHGVGAARAVNARLLPALAPRAARAAVPDA